MTEVQDPPVRSREEVERLLAQYDGLVWRVLVRKPSLYFGWARCREDIVQEMRVKLWQCLQRWRPEKGTLTTYCCVCLANCATKIQRRLDAGAAVQLSAIGEMSEKYLAVEDVGPGGATPQERFADLYAALGTLKPKERDVITRMFGIGRTAWAVDSLAASYGLSRQRISQISRKALGKLARRLKASELAQLGVSASGSSRRSSGRRPGQSPSPAPAGHPTAPPS